MTPGAGDGLYVNVGCGDRPIAGFVNIDVSGRPDRRHDVTRGMPFADRSVDGIFSEHFLEHLTQAEGLRFLRECRRVLRTDGRIRIAMPDLDELVRRYASEDWRGDGDMFRMGYDWVDNRCEMLNVAMREWGHRWVYNEEEIVRAARMAGLQPLGRQEFGASEVERLRGLEYRRASRLIMEFALPRCESAREPGLVSILIPAYQPRFFPQAIASALAQSYARLEVVVCDDSEGQDIERITREAAAADARVSYKRNVARRGGMLNYARCLEVANGEYVKFLNDDDLLLPNCVERMTGVLADNCGIRLVTSRRRRIDEQGGFLDDIPATRPLLAEDSILPGAQFAEFLLSIRLNVLGEPSTALFRRQDADEIRPHLLSFGGSPAVGLGDVALWLNLMSRGDVAYLAEPLSLFRRHGAQRQLDPDVVQAAWQSWRTLRYHGRRLGLLPSRIPRWSFRHRPIGGKRWRWRHMPWLGLRAEAAFVQGAASLLLSRRQAQAATARRDVP